MNYQQTLDFLFGRLPMFQRIGGPAYKADLSNTINLCKQLGHPEKKFKSVHIAGTNGKGSVSHFIASVLQEAGYKTGLNTSPHLKDFRERIKIKGKKIPKSKVIDFVRKNQKSFAGIDPSFFEYTFGMAVDYFNEENVDIAVMETGMGGRLDSTNVVNSILSVITNIGLDHTQFLGDTLEKIAVEKAGIIKNNIPVVIGETQKETNGIFIEKAARLRAPISFADQNLKISQIISGVRNNFQLKLNIDFQGSPYITNLMCPLTGNYQHKNIITGLHAVQKLIELGYEISEQNIHEGFSNVIKNTGFQGRWQVLRKRPLTICDAGHNEDGIREVVNQLSTIDCNKLHIVLGIVKDKKINAILNLLPLHATYYFCKADIPRGLDAEELWQTCQAFGLKGKYYNSVENAYNAALGNATSNDLVFVGGSTFVVAEVL